MPAINLSKVTKGFVARDGGEVAAVRTMDLEVPEGELLALTGPSGCGKTTLLRLIAGLAAPDAGTIAIAGKPLLAGMGSSHRIGMIFQQPALYPRMTVFDNITFGLKVRGMSSTDVQSRARAAAGMAGINHLLAHLPHELSGGECQRVALARSLALEPLLLLLDEPLSSVDACGKAQLRDDILRLQRQLGITMVYVTHDQFEAMSVGHRIALMNNGRLQQTSPPMEMYDRPASAFVASFFGVPPMNLLAGVVAAGPRAVFALDGAAGDGEIRIPVPGILRAGPILLGVRPESLQFSPAQNDSKFSLPVEVESVQFAGAESHIRCMAAGQRVIARASRSFAAVAGEPLFLSADWTDVKAFAADDEGRLVHAGFDHL